MYSMCYFFNACVLRFIESLPRLKALGPGRVVLNPPLGIALIGSKTVLLPSIEYFKTVNHFLH